jgi:hypothetical protein
MKALKFTKDRREAFLTAMADTGIVSAAASIAGITRARAYQVRKCYERCFLPIGLSTRSSDPLTEPTPLTAR